MVPVPGPVDVKGSSAGRHTKSAEFGTDPFDQLPPVAHTPSPAAPVQTFVTPLPEQTPTAQAGEAKARKPSPPTDTMRIPSAVRRWGTNAVNARRPARLGNPCALRD